MTPDQFQETEEDPTGETERDLRVQEADLEADLEADQEVDQIQDQNPDQEADLMLEKIIRDMNLRLLMGEMEKLSKII